MKGLELTNPGGVVAIKLTCSGTLRRLQPGLGDAAQERGPVPAERLLLPGRVARGGRWQGGHHGAVHGEVRGSGSGAEGVRAQQAGAGRLRRPAASVVGHCPGCELDRQRRKACFARGVAQRVPRPAFIRLILGPVRMERATD